MCPETGAGTGSRRNESPRRACGVGLPIVRAVAASNHLWRKARHQLAQFRLLEQPDIIEAQTVLLSDDGDKLFCLSIAFGDYQMPSLAIVQVCRKLCGERRPAG